MATNDRVQLIIPTSINVLTAVNDVFLQENRNGDDLAIALPSLRRRALMIVNEVGVLPIQTVVPADDSYTR
jgi:low affinity Fe/Cu permease